MMDAPILLAIVAGVELARRWVVLAIARRIATPAQVAALVRTWR